MLEHKVDALKAQEKMAASKQGSAADGITSKVSAAVLVTHLVAALRTPQG